VGIDGSSTLRTLILFHGVIDLVDELKNTARIVRNIQVGPFEILAE
jgi:hypothetical protein